MKIVKTAFAVAALASALSTVATAADYVVDTKNAHASINFRIKHLGFSWLAGRFDKFTGTFSYDDKNPDASKVKIEIDTASVDTNHAERDKHLRAADLLDTDRFPTATFESTSVKSSGQEKATVSGKLTLHGVTKDIVIEAQRVGGGKDPWGGYRDGFTGTTTLKLADFGISRDLGPFSKEVELTLDLEGIKQ
ncbi:polyprenyl-pyrophosphate binding protein [Hyphomicrobium sp. GJ21]|uniref:YceI family protein n=1 Tax=Hyphomicrobium sp. GJ21 TaxID=113574 RepID=UPI000622B83A|nr:YceI family protein [Hyphomicrobium sp. GJ21]CEJ83266.1 polyprenyl-pyrophosphate binding protein [Hyphomicrobium sp. GJ21]